MFCTGGMHMIPLLACTPAFLQEMNKYSCTGDALSRLANLFRNPPVGMSNIHFICRKSLILVTFRVKQLSPGGRVPHPKADVHGPTI